MGLSTALVRHQSSLTTKYKVIKIISFAKLASNIQKIYSFKNHHTHFKNLIVFFFFLHLQCFLNFLNTPLIISPTHPYSSPLSHFAISEKKCPKPSLPYLILITERIWFEKLQFSKYTLHWKNGARIICIILSIKKIAVYDTI